MHETITLTFYKQNTAFLEIAGLKDQSVVPNVFINDAVATATLRDKPGNAIAGFNGVTGVYQAGSNGVYRFPVDALLFNPPVGTTYTLVIRATKLTSVFHVEIPTRVAVRALGTEF